MNGKPPAKSDFWTQALYLALAEPVGLLLATSDTARARQRLYQARARLADPGLEVLQFRASPYPDGDLVITKVRVGGVER